MDKFEKRIRVVDDFEIREQGDDKSLPIITGHAALFNSLSEEMWGFREIIAPGFFDDVLDNDVRATVNHDANFILGRKSAGTMNFGIDDRGLWTESHPPDTSWFRDLLVSMRRGDVKEMSFEFQLAEDGEEWEFSPAGYWLRTLLKCKELRDVSVVSFPAYPETTAEVRARFEKKKEALRPPENIPLGDSLRALDMDIRLKRMKIDMG